MHPRLALLCALFVVALRPLLWTADAHGWDEVLFLNAVDQFDISRMAPHPPGFPYYVMLGKTLTVVLGSAQVAFAVLGTAGALAGFFGTYRLAVWIHADQRLALAAATLYAFVPAQWVYHGAFYSDSPAAGCALLSLALLATGVSRARRFDLGLGALVSALAIGIRPHIVVLLFVPWMALSVVLLVRGRHRDWLAAAGLLVVGLLPGVFVVAHNFGSLGRAVAECWDYLLAAQRRDPADLSQPGMLASGLARWFLDPFGFRGAAVAFVAFAGVGLIAALWCGNRARVGVATVAVGFYAAVLFVRMNPGSAIRFGLPVDAFFAVLAPASLLALRPERRGRAAAGLVITACVLFTAWLSPLIYRMRTANAPIVAALRRLEEESQRDSLAVVVDKELGVHAVRSLPSVPMYSELSMPYVPQWRLMPKIHEVFAQRRIFCLTQRRRSDAEPLYGAAWPEHFARVGVRFTEQRAAFVYPVPSRVLLGVGWESEQPVDDDVQVASERALLFVDAAARSFLCEVMPVVADVPEKTQRVEVCFFEDEHWRNIQGPSPPAVSLDARAGEWTEVRCSLPPKGTLTARACVVRTSGATEARLHVRRMRLEFE